MSPFWIFLMLSPLAVVIGVMIGNFSVMRRHQPPLDQIKEYSSDELRQMFRTNEHLELLGPALRELTIRKENLRELVPYLRRMAADENKVVSQHAEQLLRHHFPSETTTMSPSRA